MNKNGTGTLIGWGHGENEPFEFTEQIEWKRIGNRTIKIKKSKDNDFDTISYSIEEYTGPYGDLYDMLYDPNYKLGNTDIKGIWSIPGELFKRK